MHICSWVVNQLSGIHVHLYVIGCLQLYKFVFLVGFSKKHCPISQTQFNIIQMKAIICIWPWSAVKLVLYNGWLKDRLEWVKVCLITIIASLLCCNVIKYFLQDLPHPLVPHMKLVSLWVLWILLSRQLVESSQWLPYLNTFSKVA